MNRVVFKIVCYVDVLVSVALWTATEAFSHMPPYTESPSSTFNPKGTPCEGVTCPWGRRCTLNESSQATCVCGGPCYGNLYPVCGSDNRTYTGHCMLNEEACRTNSNLTVLYEGQCTHEGSLCYGVICPSNRVCVVAGNRAICVCQLNCSPYSYPVCGSDNQTYFNDCELRRKSCMTNDNITIAFYGKCKQGSVCNGYRCPSNRECSVNQYNQPVCVCNTSCSFDYNQVCGSDGVTYNNLCWLNRQACTTRTNITMARTGQCIFYEYCYGVSCTPPKTCVVDAENRTSCGCNKNCGNYYYPVCGSDNKTYDGYCQMYAAFCEANKNVTTYYYGVCSEGSNCQGIYCPDGKHCDSQQQSGPKCVCNTYCPKFYSPVCGTNNKTYNNSCELKRDACLTNTSISVRFSRRCEEGPGCSYTYCPYGRTCVEDERNQPMCVCSKDCYYGSEEVCGSDNKTYRSSCSLNNAACMTNKTIWVQHYEPCKEDSPCNGVVCSWDRYCDLGPNGRPICVCNEKEQCYGSAVCGSDNKTYSNVCELRKQSCLSSSTILWLYYGKCVEASICDRVSCPPNKRCAVDDRNRPTCVCIDECVYCQSPVCGSDNRTYNNDCEMQKAACLSNRNVTLAYRGKCDKGLTCNDISCTTGRICALNEKNQPTCVCKTDCYNYSNLVCGTDGKTYYNDCYLQREACTTDKNIKMDYYGSCRNAVH